MKDKPILDSNAFPVENQTPINGEFPEQKPKKYPTLEELIRSLGIVPKDMSLFEMAFTHASYSNEHREARDYDRLEFLGDGVLDLIVGDLLYKEHPDYNSGKLSKNRSQIVEGKNLSDLAIKLGFAPYVRFSQGEKKNAAFHGHIFEDVFESFIGAVYLERGYDYVYKLISVLMDEYVKGIKLAGSIDWKSKLQEEIQAEFKSGVTYEIVNQEIKNGSTVFTAVCKVDGVILGTGIGHNKKQAETEAAKEALLSRKRD